MRTLLAVDTLLPLHQASRKIGVTGGHLSVVQPETSWGCTIYRARIQVMKPLMPLVLLPALMNGSHLSLPK